MCKNISDVEIERRTKIAKMEQLELAVQKDRLALEDKKRNLCRIDLALEQFDLFLQDFKQMMLQFPDFVQSTIPSCTPNEYAAIQSFIDDNIQRLGRKRLYLALESTRDEKEQASEAVEASRRKSTKLKAQRD